MKLVKNIIDEVLKEILKEDEKSMLIIKPNHESTIDETLNHIGKRLDAISKAVIRSDENNRIINS